MVTLSFVGIVVEKPKHFHLHDQAFTLNFIYLARLDDVGLIVCQFTVG